MLDVLQVNKFYYPAVGGIENHVRTVAEHLDRERFASRVLASVPRGVGDRRSIEGVPVTKTASLGTVLSVPVSPGFPIRLFGQSRRADIVHHHLPNPLSVVADPVASSETPTVCTYHSDIVRQKRALRLYEPVLERFLDRVDRIVVTSPRLLDNSAQLAPFADKCEVVPLSVDVDAYGAYEGPDYDLVGGDRPVVLFVGRLNYYKGVKYLVDAMRNIEADLLVVGDGERRAVLERRATDRGVDDAVTFLGKVPDETLRYCYDVSDLFVLPSVEPSEAFGIVQLEAMASGLPVVNTSLPTGVPWVSRDGETGLTVPPRDAAALADAVTALLDDDELRATYAANALERVERRFDIDGMIDDLQALYDELVEEPV